MNCVTFGMNGLYRHRCSDDTFSSSKLFFFQWPLLEYERLTVQMCDSYPKRHTLCSILLLYFTTPKTDRERREKSSSLPQINDFRTNCNNTSQAPGGATDQESRVGGTHGLSRAIQRSGCDTQRIHQQT
jgi:hypothetical protein